MNKASRGDRIPVKLFQILKDDAVKVMVSGPITVWQIKGGKVEIVTDFISLGSSITADSD